MQRFSRPGLDFRLTPAASPVAAGLIAELDAELLRRYPGAPIHGIDAAGFERDGGAFFVGYLSGTPAVCGALRPWKAGAVEIKRMYVVPGARGQGIGRLMLKHLEGEAARRGYGRAVLETGLNQPEAIRLYESAGWARRALFGPYAGDPLSVCFEKALGG